MERTEIQEVLPGVYRLPIPLKGNPLKELNSYVFRGEVGGSGRRHLLVDTGFRTPDCKSELLEGLKLLGISIEDTDILLTHLHADHSGNGPDLIHPGNKLYMNRIDVAYTVDKERGNGRGLHHVRAERLRQHGIAEEMIEEMLRFTPSRTMAPNLEFTDYTCVDEGDRIPAGSYTLKAIHTPGHTPGHTCFQVEGTGAMILGDHVLFDISPNITDWRGVPDALGNYLDSLDKLDAYEVTIPLPGHRKPGDFHERIHALKEHHKKRLNECLGIIERLGTGELYQIAGNMTWKIRAGSWDDFPPAQRWFALGECLAHLDHLRITGQVVQTTEKGKIQYYVK